MATPTLRDRIRGCFVGVAVGDALGMPWELCSHEEIAGATSGRGVRGLEAMPDELARKKADPRGVPLGSTTDDWQLTEAVATSLIRCRGFDPHDQGVAHANAYRASIKGWGGSTRDAIGAYVRWLDSGGASGRRPGEAAPPAPGRGKGNGVLMKLSPLACLAAIEHGRQGEAARGELRRRVARLSEMTHQEAVSQDVASALLELLLGKPASAEVLLPRVFDEALGATLRSLFDGGKVPSADEARLRCGTSFFASESAAFCLATALRRPDDFEGAVLEAINAGGDTDTNASIVGALVGARVGESGIPPALRASVSDAERAAALADRFFDEFSLSLAF